MIIAMSILLFVLLVVKLAEEPKSFKSEHKIRPYARIGAQKERIKEHNNKTNGKKVKVYNVGNWYRGGGNMGVWK